MIAVGNTIFRWNGASWAEEQVLVSPTGFFNGMAISGSTALLATGISVAVFVRNGASGVQQAELVGSGIGSNDLFGAGQGSRSTATWP